MAGEIDPATGVAATGGVLGLLTMVYQAYRKIKGDSRADHHADAKDDFRDTLIKENGELRARCDRFAHERNEALIQVARLEAKVEYLQEQIKDLEGEVAPSESP